MSRQGFGRARNENFESYHEQAEGSLLRSLSNFGKKFQGVQDVYTEGSPPLIGEPLSLLITNKSELIQSVHNFKTALVTLYTLGYRVPFDRIDKTVDLFFWILRHCANFKDWGKIGDLETIVRDCREEIHDCRERQIDPYYYDAAVMHHFSNIDECLLGKGGIRDIIFNREQLIKCNAADVLPYSHFNANPEGVKLQQLEFDFNKAFDKLYSKIDNLKDSMENTNSKLDYGNSKLESIEQSSLAIANGKKHRTSLQLSDNTLVRCAQLWIGGRSAKGWKECKPGRRNDKSVVFYHNQAELEKLGVHTPDEYRRAIDNARKQHPELFEKKSTRKNRCQPTLL